VKPERHVGGVVPVEFVVDIPDDLLQAGQRIARAEGATLQELIERGLRAEIERAGSGVPYRWDPLVGGRSGALFPAVPPHLLAYGESPDLSETDADGGPP
jgi:hypothetical protein